MTRKAICVHVHMSDNREIFCDAENREKLCDDKIGLRACSPER